MGPESSAAGQALTLASLPQGAFVALMLALLAFGVLQCFFGYRIFKVILGILGFFWGAALGAVGGAMTGPLFVLLFAIVGGVLGAVLFVLLFFVGIFFLGAGLGLLVGMAISALVGVVPAVFIALPLAVIGGVLALVFQKLIIILATAFGGAWSTVSSVAAIALGAQAFDWLKRPDALGSWSAAVPIAWLALGVVGVVVQYRVTGKAVAPPTTPTAPQADAGA